MRFLFVVLFSGLFLGCTSLNKPYVNEERMEMRTEKHTGVVILRDIKTEKDGFILLDKEKNAVIFPPNTCSLIVELEGKRIARSPGPCFSSAEVKRLKSIVDTEFICSYTVKYLIEVKDVLGEISTTRELVGLSEFNDCPVLPRESAPPVRDDPHST